MKLMILALLLGTILVQAGEPIRVLVWDEQQPAQKEVYPNFIGNHLADTLRLNPAFEVRTAHIDQPEHGLSKAVLDRTDVLIWWGHVRHHEIPQATGDAIVERVKAGRLALLPLHSAHWSVPFRTAMEARLIQDATKMIPVHERHLIYPEFIQWRSSVLPSRNERPTFDTRVDRRRDGTWHLLLERPSCVFPACCTPKQPSLIRTLLPSHPIAAGLPATFTLPETEMYDEPFHVPEPDEVIFREHWAGGEYFRSGLTWKIGRGWVFYFRPGHETYNVYHQPAPLQIIENACAYLGAKVQAEAARPDLRNHVGKMLVFSKTSWYRHPAIPMINDWLVTLAHDHGFAADVTEDPSVFDASRLAPYSVLLLVSTTDIGKSLNGTQKESLKKWFRDGNGMIGMHAAGVHHDTWDWFSELFGTDFDSDSEYVPAVVQVDPSARNHPVTRDLPGRFTLDGDWLNFKASVRGLSGVQILLTLDESTYDPVRPLFKERGGKAMGQDHPMAWTREFEGGRFAYTMIGHDTRPLETDFAEAHFIRLIQWAAGAKR